MTDPAPPAVAILLATYNGERFLAEQLDSLTAQTVPRLDVLASDDGSTDGTLALLAAAQQQWSKGRFDIVEGPRRGFSENFRSLAQRLEGSYDFVACSDQDDIWDADKLAVAIAQLRAIDPPAPAVYFSRTRLIDEHGRVFGQSPLFSRPPSFRNAIVQSLGGGNTMVLNRPAFALFAESARRTPFVTHDWWAYMLISGAGGQVLYDPTPHIGYRQHADNVVGNSITLAARVTRLFRGQFSGWTDQNLTGLDACRDLLSDDARAVLGEMQAIHRGRSVTAVARLAQTGIYRQTSVGSLSLRVAALLGKV